MSSFVERIHHSAILQFSQINVRENLRERCLGDLEGFTRTEVRTAAPEALKVFMKNDDSLPIPVRLALSPGFEMFCRSFTQYSSNHHMC